MVVVGGDNEHPGFSVVWETVRTPVRFASVLMEPRLL